MGYYYTLCHNTYAYSLLFYKVYIRRENAGSWNSGLEKEQILETYPAQLQKSWNSTKVIFGNNKNTERKKYVRGASTCPRGWGARTTPWARSLPRGPPVGPPVPIFCYMKSFVWRKIRSKLSGWDSAATRRNQSRAPAELFCRGNFPPGGGNRSHFHHQWSSHREGVNVINIFPSTISSQTLVHLLCLISVSKPQIGTCGLLVVLITPCSWC